MLIFKERSKKRYEKKRECEVRICQVAKKNPKLFFSYIRNKNKKTVRNNLGPLVDNDDKLFSDDKDMASIHNLTFSRVFTEKDKADIPTPLNMFQGYDEEKIIITEIQTHEVHKYLLKIINSESIWVELINGREKLIIGNIYKPPNLSREASTLLF